MLPSGPKTSNLEPTCPPRAPTCFQRGHINPLKPLKNQRFLKVFATSTDLQHDTKKQTNMMPKTSQHGAQDPQLGAKMAPRPPNLDPRWPQDPPDGPKTLQLGANMAPRPPNLEPRWLPDPQFGAKNGSWAHLGRFLEPTWPPDLPTWRQDDSQTSNLGPRWLPDPSTWMQDGLQAPQLGTIK